MHVIPSSNTCDRTVTTLQSSGRLIAGTTTGLVKDINEDWFGYTVHGATLRACLADGHWGSDAAEKAVAFWLGIANFPRTANDAATHTIAFQDQLYTAYGMPNMDETCDFTPETSFIAIELEGRQLRIVSYGDCRLMIARGGRSRFVLEARATWLGAFSHLGLRQRLSAEQGMIFATEKLSEGDRLSMFTDGVDECVYEKPTISLDTLAQLSCLPATSDTLDKIFAQVFEHGAEDNATMVLFD